MRTIGDLPPEPVVAVAAALSALLLVVAFGASVGLRRRSGWLAGSGGRSARARGERPVSVFFAPWRFPSLPLDAFQAGESWNGARFGLVLAIVFYFFSRLAVGGGLAGAPL